MGKNNSSEMLVNVGFILHPYYMEESAEYEPKDKNRDGENKTQRELRVYQRRKKQNKGQSPLFRSAPTHEAPTSDSSDMIPHFSSDIELRSTSRSNAGNSPNR